MTSIQNAGTKVKTKGELKKTPALALTNKGPRPLYGAEYGSDLSKAPLSDHQPLQFYLEGGSSVGTWNILKQMNLKNAMFNDLKAKNAAFTEDPKLYETRLGYEGSELKNMMEEKKIDAFFLQEVGLEKDLKKFRQEKGASFYLPNPQGDTGILLAKALSDPDWIKTQAIRNAVKFNNDIGGNERALMVYQDGKLYVSVHVDKNLADEGNVVPYVENLIRLKDKPHNFNIQEIIVGGDFNKSLTSIAGDAKGKGYNWDFHTSDARMEGGRANNNKDDAIDGVIHVSL